MRYRSGRTSNRQRRPWRSARRRGRRFRRDRRQPGWEVSRPMPGRRRRCWMMRRVDMRMWRVRPVTNSPMIIHILIVRLII